MKNMKYEKYVNIWTISKFSKIWKFRNLVVWISFNAKHDQRNILKNRFWIFKNSMFFQILWNFRKFWKCTGCKSEHFCFWKLLLRPWDLARSIDLEISCPLAGRKLLYDPKTGFTWRVQVDNRILVPMSYLTFCNNNI